MRIPVASRSSWAVMLAMATALSLSLVAGGLVASIPGNIALYAILILLMLTGFIKNLQTFLVLIILCVFVLDGAVQYEILPVPGLWTVDGLILLLLTRLFASQRNEVKLKSRSTSMLILLLWIAAVCLSAVANATPVVNIVLGIRPYVRFAMLSYCLTAFCWDERFLARCVCLVTILFIVQVPIQAIQALSNWDRDYITGTLGLAPGVISLAAVGFASGLACYASATGRVKYWIGASVCLLVPVLSSSRAFVIVLPLVVLYVVIRVSVRGALLGALLFATTLAVPVLNSPALQRLSGPGGYSPEQVLRDPQAVLDELWSPGYVEGGRLYVGRFEAINRTWRLLGEKSVVLLGLGPGIAQGSRFAAFNSSQSLDLTWYGSRASQLTLSLVEWGVLGTVLYIACYFAQWLMAERLYRGETSPFWRAVAFGYSTLVLTLILGTGYALVWGNTLSAFLFWFVGGVLQRAYRRQANRGVVSRDLGTCPT